MDNQYRQPSAGDETEIDLLELLRVLIEKLPMMLAVGLLAALVTFSISKFVITPTYASTTKIYILNKQDSENVTYNDLQMGTQLTKDYAELIQSRYVLEEVIEQMGLHTTYEKLKEKISVTTLTDTRIISITAKDKDPVRAMRIANQVREAAAEHIKNVMDIEAVNVAEKANIPTVKASPSNGKNAVLGGMLGVLLVAGTAIMVYLTDDTIKTSEDVEKYLGMSTLALIPMDESELNGKKKRKKKKK